MNKSVKPVGFWIRLLANVIDSLLVSLVSYAIVFMGWGVSFSVQLLWNGTTSGSFSETYNSSAFQLIETVCEAVIWIAYMTVALKKWQTTIGKRIFHAKVVDAETLGPLTYQQCLIRAFGYILSCVVFGIGLLMVAYHPKKRGLHDLIAKTRVIYEHL